MDGAMTVSPISNKAMLLFSMVSTASLVLVALPPDEVLPSGGTQLPIS